MVELEIKLKLKFMGISKLELTDLEKGGNKSSNSHLVPAMVYLIPLNQQ